MLLCKKCNVRVAGSPERCPLCQGDLHGTAEPENNTLPALDTAKRRVSATRVSTALLLVLSFACVGLNAVFREPGKWSILAIFCIANLWVCLYFALKYKRNSVKIIFAESIILIILACCWDNYTGYYKWANTYAVPIIVILAILVTLAIAMVQRLNIGDYLFFLVFTCAAGVYAFRYTMYETAQITVVYPTSLCFVVSISAMVLLLLFGHKMLAEELKRRFHF